MQLVQKMQVVARAGSAGCRESRLSLHRCRCRRPVALKLAAAPSLPVVRPGRAMSTDEVAAAQAAAAAPGGDTCGPLWMIPRSLPSATIGRRGSLAHGLSAASV